MVSQIFRINQRINEMILDELAPEVWTAKVYGKVRTVAAIFTHVQNVRAKWVRLSAPHLEVPVQLKRTECTKAQARTAQGESARLVARMIDDVEAGRIHEFVRDGWARPWAVAPERTAEMLSYMVAHEAHHRGQVAMLAHQLDFPLSKATTSAMWSWERLAK